MDSSMIQALFKSDKVIFSKNKHVRSAVWDQFHLVHSKDSQSQCEMCVMQFTDKT